MRIATEIETKEAAFLESLSTCSQAVTALHIGNRYGGLGMSPLFDRLARDAEMIDLDTVDQAREKVIGALAALNDLRDKLTNP